MSDRNSILKKTSSPKLLQKVDGFPWSAVEVWQLVESSRFGSNDFVKPTTRCKFP